MHVRQATSIGAVFAATVMLLLPAPRPAAAQDVLSPSEQRGLTLVQATCARCHAIGRVGGSPLEIAPPFRTLHTRFPVEDLRKPLTDGIVTGHPTMAEFSFDPGQVSDIIAYLKVLER
jgi:mono/diheme cytochrome c family protein